MPPLADPLVPQAPTALRPLLGLTILVVEDSRYACEALRLMCLRSGARIRRADSLEHARRHLRVYRPTVLIVDLGLPDGSGAELISDLSGAAPRIEVILGTSGDPMARNVALAAGADGFLDKPYANLSGFQSEILRHLPVDRQPNGPRPLPAEVIVPDEIAFRDDLLHAAGILGQGAATREEADYLLNFLTGLARSAGDEALTLALDNIDAGARTGALLSAIGSLVEDRLAETSPL